MKKDSFTSSFPDTRRKSSGRVVGQWIFSAIVVSVSCLYPLVLLVILLTGNVHEFFAGLGLLIIFLAVAALFALSCSWIWFPPKEYWRTDLVSLTFGGFTAFGAISLLKMMELNRYYPQQNYVWSFFVLLALAGCGILLWSYVSLRRERYHPPAIVRDIGIAGLFFWFSLYVLLLLAEYGEDWARSILE